MSSLLEQLEHHLDVRPDQHCVVHVDDDGVNETALSFRDLDTAARAVAGSLVHRHGFCKGDHALLVYPTSLDFVVAFVACVYAGIVPVPVAPPNPLDPADGMDLFRALCDDCEPRAILTNTKYRIARQAGRVKTWATTLGRAGWPRAKWVDTTRLRADRPLVGRLRADPRDIALLQYTSGSTSTPKGVPLTHANLAHQCTVHAPRCLMGPDIRGVVWLPHFHDYFLISSLLVNLHHGGCLWFCSPLAFLKRPALWFELIHRVRATHTAAPNFAYGMAVAKTTPDERARWDLSCIRQHLCGAEPIHASTIDAFHTAFGCTGIDSSTFAPGYGLAEHTVAVTTAGTQRIRVDRAALAAGRIELCNDPARSQVLIGNGPVVGDIDLRIVDPDTRRECAYGRTGEVWVDSPSKGPGYHRRPEETRARFHARLEPDNGRTYLRTGDLGVVFAGEVYVTGRHKELIIVRGRNLHPHDLEATAMGVPGVRKGGVLAFAIRDDHTEGYGMLIEPASPGQTAGLAAHVSIALAKGHGVAPTTILIGRRGTVPKTTSGKLRRRFVSDRYAAQDPAFRALRVDVPSAGESTSVPSDQVLALLARHGVQATADTPLRDLGLDSLRLVQVAAELDEIGIPGAFECLLSGGTVSDLQSGDVVQQADPSEIPALTAFQCALLHDTERVPNAHVLSLPFTLSPPPDFNAVVASLQKLPARHPLLGMAFSDGAPRPGKPLVVGHHACPTSEVDTYLRQLGTVPLDLTAGPAIAADVITSPDRTTVLLRMHHVAYDAEHAFQVIANWLDAMHHRLGGPTPTAPPATDRKAMLEREARALDDAPLRAFWKHTLEGAQALPLPRAPLTHGCLEAQPFAVQTAAVQQAQGGTPFATLLTAYQLALAAVLDVDDVTVAATVSQRHRAHLRHVEGPAVQYVAFRLTISGTLGACFDAASGRVQRALQHSAVPLDSQLSAAGLPDYADNVGLQACMNLYDLGQHPLGARLSALRSPNGLVVGDHVVRAPALPPDYPAPRPYPLMLTAFVGPDGVAGQLRSHPERVQSATARKIVEAMSQVLGDVLRHPDRDAGAWVKSRR